MAQKVRIALDAMGGDFGPAVVISGADISLARHPDTEFVLFGDEVAIRPLLEARPRLKAASRLTHTDVVVKMDAKPSQALRRGRGSSMWLAIEAVIPVVNLIFMPDWWLCRSGPWSIVFASFAPRRR